MPGAPGSGLDGQVPGRSGRLHAPLPLRRHAAPHLAPSRTTTRPPTADADRRPRSPAGRGRAAARAAPGRRERAAARDARHGPSADARSAARNERPNDRVDASEVAHHDRTHADPDDYETPVTRASRSAPRLAFPVPASASAALAPDRPPCSLLHGPHAPRSLPSRLPPPRLRPSTITPGLACPVFVWQVEEGGSSAKRWTPLPRKPRREAKSGPEAGRRPVRLLRRTPRDEHQEPNTQRRTGRGLALPRRWIVWRRAEHRKARRWSECRRQFS